MNMLYTDNVDNEITTKNKLLSMYKRFISYIDLSEDTAKTYSRSLKQLFKYLAEHNVRTPKREDVLNYKQALINKHLAPSTIQTYLIAVRRFFKWAHQEQLYPNIADNVKGVKISK